MKKKNQLKNNDLYRCQVVRNIECVDWLGVIATLSGLDFNSKGLEEVKKKFLLSDDNTEQEYQGVLGRLTATRDSILSRLMKEQKLSVVNPTSYQRKEYVKLDDGWYLAQVEGYDVATLTPVSTDDDTLTASQDSMSNGIITLRFDGKGDIESLQYGESTYQWNITQKQFFTKGLLGKKTRRRKLVSVNTYIDGARVVRESVFNYACNSVVEQIALYREEQKIEFTTRIAISDAKAGVSVLLSGKNYEDVASCWQETDGTVVAGSFDEQKFCLISKQKFEETGDAREFCVQGKGRYVCDYTICLLDSEWQDSNVAEIYSGGVMPLIVSDFLPSIRPVISVENSAVMVRHVELSDDGKYVTITFMEMYNQPCSSVIKVGFRSKGAYQLDEKGNMIAVTCSQVEFLPLEVKKIAFEL
ncbi:MAG: hypothetical protein ACI4MI_05050 [Christensenellales bacterium]